MNDSIQIRFDGSVKLKPEQQAHEMHLVQPKSQIVKKELKLEGDNSNGIEGSISISDKESAIMLVSGIVDNFDITAEDLGL